MKKLLLILSLFAGVSAGVSGQTVPNGNFESWNTTSFDNFTSWWNSNPQSYQKTGLPSFFKSTTAHSGSYAAEIKSVSNGLDTMGGYLLSANPNNKQQGNGNVSFVGGLPYSATPTKFTGYYKYSPVGKDTAGILVIFKKGGVIISQDMIKLGAASAYTAFSMNLSLKSTPDTVVIGMVSSYKLINNNNWMTGIIPGSTLYIDDIAFTGTSSMPAIPNGDFESGWTTSSILSPAGWTIFGDPGTVNQITDKYDGNYAIALTTISSNNDVGISTGKSSSHSGPVGGGRPFTNLIDTLIGYYKYSSVGGDSSSVFVQFSKNAHQIWGTGTILGPSSSYKQFSIPINLQGNTPDSMRIDIWNNNSNQGIAHIGTTLKLDDIQLKSAPLHNSGIGATGWIANKVKVYPNPASQKITFEFSNLMLTDNVLTFKVLNSLGEIVYIQNYAGKTDMINLDISGYKNGIYFYNFLNGKSLVQGSFIKN